MLLDSVVDELASDEPISDGFLLPPQPNNVIDSKLRMKIIFIGDPTVVMLTFD